MIFCILNICSPVSIHLFIHSFFLQSFCLSIHHPSFHLSTHPSSHPYICPSVLPPICPLSILPFISHPSFHPSFNSSVHYPSFHLPIFSSSILLSIHSITITQPYHLYCLFGNYQKELYTIFYFNSQIWDICFYHPRWKTRTATPGSIKVLSRRPGNSLAYSLCSLVFLSQKYHSGAMRKEWHPTNQGSEPTSSICLLSSLGKVISPLWLPVFNVLICQVEIITQLWHLLWGLREFMSIKPPECRVPSKYRVLSLLSSK